MLNFILCTKYTCPHANECYRLRASPDSEDQRYESFIGLCNEEDEFHFFIKINPEDKIIELEKLPEIGIPEA